MDAMQYSPLALAFIGDGVYEIRVREKLILEANMPADKLHKLTVERVCAEYQAKAVRKWLDEELLNEQEMDIFKRGRNAKGHKCSETFHCGGIPHGDRFGMSFRFFISHGA